MRVLHVVSSISRASGGSTWPVQGLVAGLSRAGVEAWLLALRRGHKPWVDGIDHFVNGEAFENVVLRVRPQIVHLHGLWSLSLHRCAVICRRWHIPYVIAPRGMLEPWSLQQKWLKKRIARLLYQDHDLKCAAALHATAESEAEQFRRLGFKNPVIISPNGVNVPKAWVTGNGERIPLAKRVAEGDALEVTVVAMHKKKQGKELSPPPKYYRPLTEVVETVAKHQAAGFSPSTTDRSIACLTTGRKGGRRILFVSRMHPKKGVLELVEAFKKVVSGGMKECGSEGVKEWKVELVYTVSGEVEREYEAKVRERVKELGLEDRFIFTGALNDDEKWEAYARADLFVLPTFSENFGIVVAEALWAGVPVVTTKGTPWQELEECRSGWWIDLPTEGSNPSDWSALVSALGDMMSISDDERREMGERGRKLVEEKYTWDAVVKNMVAGYENIR